LTAALGLPISLQANEREGLGLEGAPYNTRLSPDARILRLRTLSLDGPTMQLTTKGRYAVMAMADLAGQSAPSVGCRAVSLAEIAARQEISLAYLEQLFARLRRQGLVESARGPGGGYRLARAPAETRISDIVAAVDEPMKATRCVGHDGAVGCMTGGAKCLTHDLWAEMGRQMHDYLASVSLADVLAGRLRPAGAAAA
jgi:Rrf2 family iron-sulfur cluster assembly transcriptional regulator